jgi:site-specific DNA recombinase
MKTIKTNDNLEALLQASTQKKYKVAIKRDKPFAVVYTRVSSQEQAENNSSLEIQNKLCTEYASRNGLTIKHFFGGTYESAKTDGRKEFQRMLFYIHKDKEISFILVYNFDRFSRTGTAAAQLSEQLREKGITLKSITQDIDSNTPSGGLQENFFHIFNSYENQQRATRTKINTREVMLKGYWPYATPLGYKNLKPKHRACEHQYIITEEGKFLKEAFKLKAQGTLTNKEIAARVSVRGLRLTPKNFRWILSNPFYTGYVTGNLLGGKLVKGKHPSLIDLKTFLKANDLLKMAVNTGIAKSSKREDLPLKIFARE